MSDTPNRPARLNRGLLTLIGILLVLAGAFTLARGLGVLPPLPRSTPLLSRDLTAPGRLPYAVIVAAAVVGVLCLMWIAAQIGRRRPSSQTWRLPVAHGGSTLLDTDAAATAVAEEIETYTGVHKAGAAITGARAQPVLHLTLTTEDDTDITDLRRRIATEALPRLRRALEVDDLPAEILLRLGSAGPAHRTR